MFHTCSKQIWLQNEVAPGCHDDIAVGVVVVAAAVLVVVDDVNDVDDVDFLAVR